MSTRADYRNRLKNKVLGLEDEGYGDFEFTDAEYNTYLEMAVARLFPALYKRLVLEGLEPTSNYGSNNFGSFAVPLPDRVYLVEDTDEQEPIHGWSIRGSSVMRVNTLRNPTVNIHYIDAYTLPDDDVTDAGIPEVYTPLIVLGGLVEALESRHDGGARPDPSTGHQETTLIDRLTARYEALKNEQAMSLPAVIV